MSPDLTLLTVQEVAAELRCSVSFVRTIIASGELVFVKTSKRFMVTQGDLAKWVERARGHHGEADLPRKSGKVRGNRVLKAVKSA